MYNTPNTRDVAAAGSKPAVTAIKWLQTHILDHVTTRMGTKYC